MSYTFHEEEYRGCKIRIESDDDPLNPRKDYDNVGTMVCFHDRYDLGDVQQKRGTGDEYLRGLVPGSVMQQFDDRRNRAYNNHDTGYGRPKRLSSETYYAICERIDKAEEAAIERWIDRNLVILTLYLYDHSGITMSTGAFSCPWDSGRVGFIYCTLEKALHEWGTKGQEHLGWDGEASYTPKPDGSKRTLREAATSYLEGEVETYDDYLTGQVAYWVAEDPEGETIESVGGYFPDHSVPHSQEWDYPIGEARAAIDHWHNQQDKEATEAAHWAARDVQTISQPT